MNIDMMRIIVPPEIIGEGYRRVDTNTETWQEGDEWLYLQKKRWASGGGSGWGDYIIRRKVAPKKVWTEKDIACCAEIRSKDLPQELIEEAVQRMVDLFNSDKATWYRHTLGRKTKDEVAKKSLMDTFVWDEYYAHRYWKRIDSAPTKPKGCWEECKVTINPVGLYVATRQSGSICTLAAAQISLGFGGFCYGNEWTKSLRFDGRGILMRPYAVRFWTEE